MLWNGPPRIWHLVDIFEILLLHVLYNDACKFAINLFPSPQGHLKMLIYSIFYWKCWFEMAVMCLILQETLIKDINVNLSFLSSGWNVVEWIPPGLEKKFKFISEFRIKSCGMDPPGSDIWWTFLKFYFCMYCTMMYVNLPYLVGQKKFGDERPFTREGNYLVFIYYWVSHKCIYTLKIC